MANVAQLDLVFGADATGSTPAERARTSRRKFVRSQSQLGLLTERAKGLEITPEDALELVGFDGLLEIIEDGATVINPTLDEPSRTIRERRMQLDLLVEDVARASGLDVEEVTTAEQPGTILPIRKLMRLAQVLSFEDETLGAIADARADRDLAYRLRTLKQSPIIHLSAGLVLKLTEAAWVISKQHRLARMLGLPDRTEDTFQPDTNYRSPAWKRGWELAEATRQRANLGAEAPITSVRALIDHLNIPLVQAELGQTFAGATLENGGDRGIVVNIEGDNGKVWVRRVTLCHELGHLLWDPTSRLERLHVDRYADIHSAGTGSVEARANAFSIAFLAPPRAVLEIARQDLTVPQMLAEIMSRFGIPGTAAKFHLTNVAREWGLHIDTSPVRVDQLPVADEEWETRESWTVDFYPVPNVPINRRGKFAGLIGRAVKAERMTLDYAAMCLGVDQASLVGHIDDIISLAGD